jgi:hypothetical protein
VTVSTDGGDLETLSLAETSLVPGVFVGTISTALGVAGIEDGKLEVSDGEVITATYSDSNDGRGIAAMVTDVARADCQRPVILDMAVDVPGPAPMVSLQTNEPTTVRVLYSHACQDPNVAVATDSIVSTSHTVKLPIDSPETDYYFVIEANDVVGNQRIDDNNELCYKFTTDGAGDIYVPAQYDTIQDAIERSWDGGTVWVADGVYTGVGNRDIDPGGKAITVRSENGPQHCIIDCEGTEADPHRGFYIQRGEDSNTLVSGFTIRNGYAPGGEYTSSSGGAIRCLNSSPTISNCIFEDNRAGWDGGAINNDSSSPIISKCIFNFNRSVGNDGGAINNISESHPLIEDCSFRGNQSYDWGGAMRNVFSSSPTVGNCIFRGNIAGGDGGAILNYDRSNPKVVNCSFIENRAVGNDGGAINNVIESNAVIQNCRFSGNRSYDWGGAIRNIFSSSATISNCMFCGNVAGGKGGAIFNWESCNTRIINCTFADNFAPKGNGVACDSNDGQDPSNLDVSNCIFSDGGDEIRNEDGSIVIMLYSDVQGGYAGVGNIDADPCFVARGYWADANGGRLAIGAIEPDAVWVEGNYHLSAASACIDAGDPNYQWSGEEKDIDGQVRVFDSRVDIGADEHVPPIEVAMKFTPQALNSASKGNWIKAHFVLPDGFVVEDVDANIPSKVTEPFEPDIESEYVNVFVNEDALVEVEAAFGRAEFCAAGTEGDSIEVTATGLLTSGQQFYGTETIKITDGTFEHLAGLASRWLEATCSQPDWCEGVDLDQDGAVNFVDFALFNGCRIQVIPE